MFDSLRYSIPCYMRLRNQELSFSECATGFDFLWRMRACAELIKQWYADTRYFGLKWRDTKPTIKAVCGLLLDHYCGGESRELECICDIADSKKAEFRFFIEVHPSRFGYSVRHCTQAEYWGY